METERLSPRYSGIDAWSPGDVLAAMVEAQFAAVAAVAAARPALEGAALAIEARLRGGAGRLIYAGAGTSGRLAVQDGAELMPTFGWPPERLLLLIAGGREALTEPVEGAEDEPAQALELMERHDVAQPDALVAVAASGTTAFTLACLAEAGRRRALTVGIANNAGTELLTGADCPILLDTGPEPIAGSTRLKAGTAQKVALNLLSSLLMIRLGHVYEGLMVDVQTLNRKLIRRSEAMVCHLTGATADQARQALERSGGSVKLAVLVVRGCAPEAGRRLLEEAGGSLRAALAMAETDRDPAVRRG